MSFDAERRPDDSDEPERNFPAWEGQPPDSPPLLDPVTADAKDRAYRASHRAIAPDGTDDEGSPNDTDLTDDAAAHGALQITDQASTPTDIPAPGRGYARVKKLPWDAFEGVVTDSAAYAALSGGCNSEIKALALGFLATDEPSTASQLHGRVMEVQGEAPVWPTLRVGTVQGYCETFVSAGLVDVHHGSVAAHHGNPDAYTLSQDGVQALPRVGNLLGLSLMESPPLFAYFGPSGKHSEDPTWVSERRVGVLRVVRDVDGEEISSTTVARRIGGHENSITTIVDDLALHGLVSMSSSGRNGARVRYHTTDKILEHTAHTDFGGDVLSLLVAHHRDRPAQSFTNRDIVDQLLAMGYVDEPTFIIKVASRVAQLESKHGALHATRLHGQTGVASVVSATQEQLHVIDSLFRALGRGYTHAADYEAEGLTTLQVIRTDTEFANHLLTKARVASTALKSRPEAQDHALSTLSQVLQIMDRPLTNREAWELLQTEGLHFDPDTVQRKLQTLVQLGKVGLQAGQNGIKNMYVWLT